MEEEATSLETERQNLNRKIEKEDELVYEKQESKREVESFTRTVQNIAKYHSEIHNFERQISDLAAKQNDSRKSRGLEKIQDDLKKLNEQSRSMKSSLTQLSADRARARSYIKSL